MVVKLPVLCVLLNTPPPIHLSWQVLHDYLTSSLINELRNSLINLISPTLHILSVHNRTHNYTCTCMHMHLHDWRISHYCHHIHRY